MRIDLGPSLDRWELAECAERYGRPAGRWLLRHADKNHLFQS